MKKTTLLLAVAALLLVTSLALALDGYDLSWWTVDGGGASYSTGGGYALGGTAGQPDAGLMEGGGYSLAGGFWPGGSAAPEPRYLIYLPLGMRGY
ncbi:MAG TPA: hypothetical protein PKO09_03440 [Anaerolineae bacterium]|nr:hypothetical protein [Anaerolineae bacterium]